MKYGNMGSFRIDISMKFFFLGRKGDNGKEIFEID